MSVDGVNGGANFTALGVRGRSRIVLFDAGGHRSFGAFADHTPESVRCLDIHLDALDAANELPDGTLPAATAARRNEAL